MFRNMVTSLFKHGRIQTTDAKAKELRRWADHMVTLAKRGDLHARRQALAIANEKAVVHRLFEKAAEQFGDRAGGYTRLIKLGRRPGDAAPMTMVELVTEEVGDKSKKKSRKTKKQAAAPQPAAAPKSASEPAPVDDTTADSSQAEADDTAPAPETVADQNAELEEAPAAKVDEADDSAATDADAAETADNSEDESEEEKSE